VSKLRREHVRTRRLMPDLDLLVNCSSSHILSSSHPLPISKRSTYRFGSAHASLLFAITLALHPSCHNSEPHLAAVCNGPLWRVRAVGISQTCSKTAYG
jgi:hypothetical protein